MTHGIPNGPDYADPAKIEAHFDRLAKRKKLEARIQEADVSEACKHLARRLARHVMWLLEDPGVFWSTEDDTIIFEEPKVKGCAIEVTGNAYT